MAAPMAVTAAQAAIGRVTALAADDTAVRLRPLRSDEQDLVAAFVAGLSAQSRCRFLQALPRLPQRLLRYLADVDGRRHVAVVAEAGDQIAGIARFLVLPGELGTVMAWRPAALIAGAGS
jgi:hypothetical protein